MIGSGWLGRGKRPAEPARSALSALPATRASRPGWRDSRLWAGLGVVVLCGVAGARVVGSADDTVQVWALAHDEAAGSVLTAADLVARRVHFGEGGDLAAYVRTDQALPASVKVARDLGAGELLPRAALATGPVLARLPLAVDPAAVPSGVEAGSAVDVYIEAAGPVLDRVAVVEVTPGGALDGSTQVTVAVPPSDVAAYFAALKGRLDPKVTLVGRS